ncbi:glycoside hydrolase family 5 protein [Purpureocillium lavendulum]|uniref:mannan endo-1,4-beta-mannosidase n=1 Tax=Purpureocillium lavendulum TaxID=1247861 RepID=A0AB34FES9_9HYPO|nr:glycoside hydrolase family 5 protein [Purpureocillium lavendulum]
MRLSIALLLTASAATQAAPASDSWILKQALAAFHLTPQILDTFLRPLQVLLERNTHVYRDGTQLKLNGAPWTAAGANVYWLGLDENVIPPAGSPFYPKFNASYPSKGRIVEVMNTLQTMGARTIRSQTLGISVGNPLSLMPSLDEWNDEALEAIDWAIFQARQHGLRVQVPLTDNYDYYHGGKFDFCRFRGINVSGADGYGSVDPRIQQFYTNRVIINDFKRYIKKLITHVNPYTGLSYADDSTIYAYETGNELSGPIFRDMNVPNEWTVEISRFVKSLAPKKLIMDGTYGINKTHLTLKEVDMFSNHFYPTNTSVLRDDIEAVGAAGKTYMAGEYDWTGNIPSASSLEDFFGYIEKRQATSKPVAVGSQFWSLFMHNVPDCTQFVNHTDGFSLQYGNPLNTAHNNSQIAKVRKHLFRMKGIEVDDYLPASACPGVEAEYGYQ